MNVRTQRMVHSTVSPTTECSSMFFNAGSAARQRGKVYKKLLFTERGNTQKLYKKSGSAARQWGKVYKKLLFTERGNTQKLYKKRA